MAKIAREIAIADHLWQAFDELAASMATDRESLINQAMFVFARLNGAIELGPIAGRGVAPPIPAAARPPPPPAEEHRPGSLDENPERRAVAARVLRTADALQKHIDDVGSMSPESEDVPVDLEPSEAQDEGELGSSAGGLYFETASGVSEQITKDRFIIGRGKDCDLVINSGKVSRQHAVIVREGDDYFIEDLKSANGTWFQRKRITRLKVVSGEQYFICSEGIRLVIR